MSTYARLRADVDTREGPSPQATLSYRFPTNCLVEILDDQGEWLKVKPVRINKTQSGYVPRIALIFPPQPKPNIFPDIAIGEKTIPSVPATLKLSDFRAWQAGGGKPAWIKEEVWTQLSQEQQEVLLTDMAASITSVSEQWDAWVTNITVNQRAEEATMEEWIVTLQGGQEVYTIRDHYVYKQPAQNEQYFGCALKGQIMLWSGDVQASGQGDTRRQFKKITFFRMRQRMEGWFRSDITQEYVYPEEQNDPEIPANSQNVFDLTTPILRHPQDQEITDATTAGFTGAQYIDIRRVINKALRHWCLCGEFCVAALGGMDIIPLLQSWNNPPVGNRYWRVDEILTNPKMGTGTGDLQSLLPLANLPKGEIYSSTPAPMRIIKERLESGEFAIAGCGITSGGTIKANGSIAHWVVVEDVLPVGNSGWVRVYNPFRNREEVYEYNMFLTSNQIGNGLWIEAAGI